ncbi:hypothetical protein PanWU01x14_325310 [Parasponia andersonii]|uniref:Uncharacterized protein n=1 Tax=Parasponia andersonii TaxID=3476 RepID=A0A2P5AJW6_PARAD|nr:hypothetical protein PanWU01x14_325310 [Parasponia andersonii]
MRNLWKLRKLLEFPELKAQENQLSIVMERKSMKKFNPL